MEQKTIFRSVAFNQEHEHIEFPRIYYNLKNFNFHEFLLVLFNCFTLLSLVHSV